MLVKSRAKYRQCAQLSNKQEQFFRTFKLSFYDYQKVNHIIKYSEDYCMCACIQDYTQSTTFEFSVLAEFFFYLQFPFLFSFTFCLLVVQFLALPPKNKNVLGFRSTNYLLPLSAEVNFAIHFQFCKYKIIFCFLYLSKVQLYFTVLTKRCTSILV